MRHLHINVKIYYEDKKVITTAFWYQRGPLEIAKSRLSNSLLLTHLHGFTLLFDCAISAESIFNKLVGSGKS
jgi:hypothetical protein